MARGFSRSGGGGGRAGGSGGGFSFGGGRSSGGGFSFGSSRSSRSSSSSSRSYHAPRPRRPWHVPMFGRTVIISTRAQSIFSLLIFVILFATVMCFFNAQSVGYHSNQIKDQKAIVQHFEIYDKDYMTLINGAENGTYDVQEFDITPYWNESTNTFDYVNFSGSYDPTVAGIYDMDFFHNGQEYFFIVYTYTYNSNSKTDWTFAQYTKYQLEDIILENNGKIKIAVGKLTNTASGDDGVYAMNMDYSLEANQEYLYEVRVLDDLKTQKNSKLLVALIFLGVDLLVVAGIVIYLVKKFKIAQRKTEAEIEKTEAEANLVKEQAKQINRKCDYCGASVPDGDDMCPACGSRIFEEKK